MALKPFDGELDEAAEAPRRVKPFTGGLDDVKPVTTEKGLTGHLRDTGLSLLKGAIAIPEAAVGLANIPTFGAAGKLAEKAGFRPAEAKGILSDLHTDQFKAQQQEFQEADGVIDKAGVALSNPSLIANVVTESAPSMLGGGVVAQGIRRAAPKVGAALAGAAGEGTVMAGAQAEQIRQQTDDGLLTAGQAGAAIGTGAAGALFGFAGGRLAQKMGIGDVDTMLAGGVTPREVAGELAAMPAKSIPRKVIEGAITEGLLEELPQSVSEQIIQNLALDRDWSEGIEDAAVMGTLAGMAMGAGANVVGSVQPQPSEQNPAPFPVDRPDPAGGVLSRAAAQLPAPEPVLRLPPPEPVTYVDGAGNAQNIGPVRNVDGEMRAEPQGRVPASAPAGLSGGRGMDQPTPRGREALPVEPASPEAAVVTEPLGIPDLRPEAFVVDKQGGATTARVATLAEPEPIEPEDGMTRQAVPRQRPRFERVLERARENGGMNAVALAEATGATRIQAARALRLAAQENQALGTSYKTVPGANRAKRALPNPDAYEVVKTANREWRLQRVVAAQSPSIVGEDIDGDWARFSPESGTMKVPRSDMPQIKAEHRGAMVNFLKGKGISHESKEVPAADLKPTQAEFSRTKVAKAQKYTGGDRSILVSSDGYVLDGHHQWLAKLEAGESVNIIQLGAPISELLPAVKEFPSAQAEAGEQAPEARSPAQAKARTAEKKVRRPKIPAATPVAAPATFAAGVKQAPAILTKPRKAYLAAMAKKAGIKKGSPGYADAMARLQQEYDAELDAASAKLPFEQYNKLNSESPESVNRQAWEQLQAEVPAFSRKGKKAASTLPRKKVQATVDAFLKRYKGADDVRVEIHDSAETLPGYRADRDSGASIQGEYDFRTGTVHLVGASLGARNGKSARQNIEETLREEILVHKGLGLLSPVARRQLYAQIKKASTENPAIKKLWDQTVAEYRDIAKTAKLTPAQADRLYAEEMLGTLAQRKINWATKGWNRILRALKRLAVRVGLIKHTDGPAELIKAVEYIADAFAKGRRARARNLTTDVRAEDADLPAFRMASTAQGAAQAREALDRALGRAKLDPTDPFAAENRRLREEDRPIWDKAKKIFARQFAPGGLLPGDVFSEKIKRDSEFEAVEFDVRHMVGALEKAVQGDYGLAANKLTEEQMRSLSEALAGKVDDSLPTNTRAGIVAMRQYIDSLSSEYISILKQQTADRLKGADQGLIDKITGNLGRYVHRSYQAYDDPKWFKQVPVPVLNSARNYLAAGYRRSGESSAEAARLADVAINEILKSGTAYDSMESFIAEGKLGAKDLSVMMKRKDVAPQIRALLGEYADPRVNFAKSATKMGRLIWNQRFLDRVREVGMGSFLFEGKNRPADATTQIAGEQSDTYSPLNGLWTFPEVAQSFKDALGKQQMGDLYRTVVRANGLVKYGKTVLSPTTAMRNWQSAMFFSLANGHFNMKHMRKSMAAFREQVSQSATGQDLAYLRKLKQLGVVYDSPYAGEMMRLLEDARMDELLSGKKGKAMDIFRKANQAAQGFYTFGDDFWKIIGFENEKASLIDAGIAEADAEKMAAERIRNTYPTYSMVGRGMRWLSRFPLAGTFVSFPSEIVRTSANMMRTTASDLKSENPKIRALGRKRAAGMAMVSAGFYALSAMTAAALGVDDDEEEAIRDLGPPWQDNSTFMYLGRDPDGKLRYVDLSFLDPYGFWKRPVTAMMRNQSWEDSAKSGVADLLTPFLGGDITAQSIFEVMSNKKSSGGQVYKENGEPLDQLADITNHIRKTIQPGFVSNAERFVQAARGQRRESTGQPYSVRDEVSALLGWRASTLDARTGLYYRSFDFNEALTDARGSLSRVLRSANNVSSDDIRKAKEGADRQYAKAFNDMAKLVSAAENAGMTRRELLQTLTLGGVSRKNAFALLRGSPPAMTITPQAQSRAVRQARVNQGAEQSRVVASRFREARTL